MLALKQIKFNYLKKNVLKDVSFSLNKGEIGTLIGSSGSGKTTLFKLLTGILSLQEGEIFLCNQNSYKHHDKISYMTQQDLLLPWRTIISNLTLLMEFGKKPLYTKNLKQEAKIVLNELGLGDCLNMYPQELSSGMRQLVSLARALLQKRPILLLDEPFSSLDTALKEEMYEKLKNTQKKYGTTILLITHDFRDALSLSDHVFFLSKGTIKKTWQINDFDRQDPKKSNTLLNEMRQAILDI